MKQTVIYFINLSSITSFIFSIIINSFLYYLVNIVTTPFTVDDLVVPAQYEAMIQDIRQGLDVLNQQLHPTAFNTLTAFIDPIDGTREFSTKLGEQCSIIVGYADASGLPAAGIVFRPVVRPVHV